MNTNPYVSPESTAINSEYSAPSQDEPMPVRRDIGVALAWFVLFPSVGGFLGFAFYLAGAMYLETNVMPTVEPPVYTYGQQSGLISLPTSTAIGILCGIGFAIFVIGYRRTSVSAVVAVAILGAVWTLSMWYDDGIGECNSAIVLYYPIFGFCAVVFTFGILLGLVTVITGRATDQFAG